MAYNTNSTLTHFVPEIWAAEILTALRDNLVFGGPGVVNRDYEGEIQQMGDTVHITTLGDPTIGDYTSHSDITVQKLADGDLDLVITEAKYFAYDVDDIEDAQVRDGGRLMTEAAQNAAFCLSDVADGFISAAMATNVDSGNQVTAVDFTTGTITGFAYEKVLLPLKLKLDKANVPTAGRWVVATPELEGYLLLDDRFVRVDASGNDTGLRNGMIGRAAGFDVLQSNSVPTVAPGASQKGTQTIIAGYPGAFSFAEQIAKVESTRMEKRFADLVKGLHLYGGKLVRTKGVATCVIDVLPATS